MADHARKPPVEHACRAVAWQRAAFPDPPSVVDVDLGSYMGRWYEVARTRVSTPFQALCGCVTADYELLDSGNVRVVNTCVKMPHPLIQGATTQAIGEAVPKAPGKLLVTFDGQPASFMADEGNYWIVDSADDGSWAVVSSMMRAPIWVLSRTPALPGGTLKDIMQRLTDRGFDAWKLRPTTQGDSCAYT
ncbi:unnamed protein product [Pedinophyceae sp. YPF-701]|nr:unnamed protein product [Pedinophyceae sp. YPF-701]